MTHITQFDNRRRSPVEIKISPHKFWFFVDISTLFRLFIEVTPFTIYRSIGVCGLDFLFTGAFRP